MNIHKKVRVFQEKKQTLILAVLQAKSNRETLSMWIFFFPLNLIFKKWHTSDWI